MRIGLVLVVVAACGGSNGAPDSPNGFDRRGPDPDSPRNANHYATTFDGDEAPLSEGGAWSHTGEDWATVIKAGGYAFGTQTGTGGYDDSYAVLSGFSPDHTASGVIHLVDPIDGSCSHEVEILLRWSDSAHDAHGYECNLAFDGAYAQIVRWNGPYGDFTYLGSGTYAGPIDGATLEASVVGDEIIERVNGVEVARATDATFADGNPGVAFFRRDCGSNTDYGFTSYAADGQ